jgi:hypothetical protein
MPAFLPEISEQRRQDYEMASRGLLKPKLSKTDSRYGIQEGLYADGAVAAESRDSFATKPGSDVRRSVSTPELKKMGSMGKPPKVPSRLPRIHPSASETQLAPAEAKKQNANVMQWVDRLLLKAREMQREMSGQRNAVAEMRDEIRREYRLAGVEDPAVAQARAGELPAPAPAPEPSAKKQPAVARAPAIEAAIEYRTHEL